MQPLKLIIPGRYWDSQIYAGRLYLFERDGDLRTVDWDRLIRGWGLEESVRLAMECAFCRSDYLYGDQWTLLFADHEVKNVIQEKFERLATISLEVPPNRLEEVSQGRQTSPFPFPHADSTIYKKNLFVVGRDGLFRATCNKPAGNPVSSRPAKEWDAPTLAVAASYNTLALAAGDEGLFEFPLASNGWLMRRHDEPVRIAAKNCTDCSWTFHSIFCSSHLISGYLASFKKEPDEERGPSPKRIFEEVIPAEDIFRQSGYSWGNQDKLCQVREHLVSIVRYTPWAENEEARLERLGAIDLASSPAVETFALAPWKGGIVSGGVAVFGTVIECERAMVVAPSEGSPVTLPGEPVNWRIFPRSVQYENQLHLIYPDRIEILSFNHDYFVDQRQKLSGTRFSGKRPFTRMRGRSRLGLPEELR